MEDNNNNVDPRQALSHVDSSQGGRGTALSTEVRNPATFDDDVVDPYFFWRIFKRYKAIFIGFTLGAAALSFLLTAMLLPTFTGEATVRINQNTSFYSIEGFSQGINWKESATTINVMESREVAKRIVSRLNLIENDEFNGKVRQRSIIPNFSALKRVFAPSANNVAPDEGKLVSNATDYLKSKLSVEELDSTDIVKVRYDAFNPEVSAKVANEVVAAFNELDSERRREVSGSVQTMLEGELEKVQMKLQASERKLNQFARITGIVDLEDRNNVMSARADSLSSEFIAAQNERMKLEIQIEGAKQSNGLMSVPFVNENPAVIAMRAELSKLQAEYGELASVFKPGYPELDALQQRINLLRSQMRSEGQRTLDSLVSKYKNATEAERVLSSELEKNNIDLLDLKDRSITFNLLKREWQSYKKLHEGLLEKVKSTALSANLEVDKLSLISPSVVPSSKSAPNMAKNVALASSGGFLLAMGLAFLLNLLDRRFRSIQEIEEATQIPVLSVVPFIENQQDLESNHVAFLPWHEPSGQIAETFRSLRTSLNYSMPGEDLETLMVTSANPSEGKSTTIVNFAITLANSGLKVILIDLDLRKPSVHNIIDKSRAPGLTDALIGGNIPVRNTIVDNFQVLTAGTSTPRPTEVLESNACKNLVTHLRKEFDVVLFDAPPVMGLADALVVSQYTKNILMVIDTQMSNKDALKASLKRLQRVNASLLGFVLTKYDATKHEDYDYQGSNYYYYYGDDEKVAGDSGGAEFKLQTAEPEYETKQESKSG